MPDAPRTLEQLMPQLLAEDLTAARRDELAAHGAAAVEAILAMSTGRYGPMAAGRYHRDLADDCVAVLDTIAAVQPEVILRPLRAGGLVDPWLLYALGASREQAVVEVLLEVLEDRRNPARESAVRSLARTGDPRALDALCRLLEDRDANVRFVALLGLQSFFCPSRIRPSLERLRLPRTKKQPPLNLGEQRIIPEQLAICADPAAGYAALRQAARRDLALQEVQLPPRVQAGVRELVRRLEALAERSVVCWARHAPPHPLTVRGVAEQLAAPLDEEHLALILEVGFVRVTPLQPAAGDQGITLFGLAEGAATWSRLIGPAHRGLPPGLVPLGRQDATGELLLYDGDRQLWCWQPGRAPETVAGHGALAGCGWLLGEGVHGQLRARGSSHQPPRWLV